MKKLRRRTVRSATRGYDAHRDHGRRGDHRHADGHGGGGGVQSAGKDKIKKRQDGDQGRLNRGLVGYQTDNTDAVPKALVDLYTQKYLTKEPKDPWGEAAHFQVPGRAQH